MPGFSHFALQKAVYETLTGDATLMSLAQGVYDFVPQTAAYPYIAIGEMTGQDASVQNVNGMQYQLNMRIFSREGGRKQAAAIMERVHALLHLADLSITGHALVMLRMSGSEITLQGDGLTYQGVMRFRAITNAT